MSLLCEIISNSRKSFAEKKAGIEKILQENSSLGSADVNKVSLNPTYFGQVFEPFHAAICSSDTKVRDDLAMFLIDKGVNKARAGRMCLAFGNLKVFKYLVNEKGMNVFKTKAYESKLMKTVNMLCIAIAHENVEAVRFCISKAKSSDDLLYCDGVSVFQLITSQDREIHFPMWEELFRATDPFEFGRSARRANVVHILVKKFKMFQDDRFIDAVEWVLDHIGDDILDSRDFSGKTPFENFLRRDFLPTMYTEETRMFELLRGGVDDPLLLFKVDDLPTSTLRFLLDNEHVKADTVNPENGMTFLHVLVQQVHEDDFDGDKKRECLANIRLILQFFPGNGHVKDSAGMTPLQYAQYAGHGMEVLHLLSSPETRSVDRERSVDRDVVVRARVGSKRSKSMSLFCAICQDDDGVDEPTVLNPCGHVFCHKCISSCKKNECPVCRKRIVSLVKPFAN